MLHYLACAAIAYFLARYLNSRFPGFVTAVWSGGVATIVGMTVGSGIVLGGMAAMGFSIDAGVIASRAFGQAFLFSVAGAAAGIYHGRQKAATGEHGAVSSIPLKAWIGWGSLSLVIVIGALAIIGKAIDGRSNRPAHASDAGVLRPEVARLDEASAESVPQPIIANSQPPAPQATAPINWSDYTPVEPQASELTAEQSAKERHFQRIYAAHPDADEVFTSHDFPLWIARNTKYVDVPTSGTTDQVIEMFSAFKRWRKADNGRLAAETARRNEAAAEALARRNTSPYDVR